jgi:putative redox protein
MEIAEVRYSGNLKTEATHERSNQTIQTDAPPDNKGEGAAFSPTDLLATSLATCMVTTMAISAEEHNLLLDDVTVSVSKDMAADPRRVATIQLAFEISAPNITDGQKQLLEEAARNCPVSQSLSSDVKQEVTFDYA